MSNIENELKYVLHPNTSEDTFNNDAWKRVEVKQGYVDGVRVRFMDDEYYLTFKKLVDNELIEVETFIDKETFDKLFKCSENSINKVRYIHNYGDEEWVVDFLKDINGQTYFIQAEVEMPQGRLSPETLNPVRNFVIYSVELHDERFTNKNLSNIENAIKLLKELL